jgi:hypothetical protein
MFKSYVSEVAFPGQRIWYSVGNLLVEAHVSSNAQAIETELFEMCTFFAVLM